MTTRLRHLWVWDLTSVADSLAAISMVRTLPGQLGYRLRRSGEGQLRCRQVDAGYHLRSRVERSGP